MSFALTTAQVRNRTKTVTRRIGWAFLKPSDLLQPVVQVQGLKKGERVEKIGGPIRVVGVRRERLDAMLVDLAYGRSEVVREGFGGSALHDPGAWIAFFCASHGCQQWDEVQRVEFEYTEK